MMKLLPVQLSIFLPLLMLGALSNGQATDVYRCTDDQGNPSYSQTPCGPDAVIETVEDRYIDPNTPQQSRSATEQLEHYRRQVKKIEKITGNKKPQRKSKPTEVNPCDQVSSLALRNARISRDIMKCHSMDDIRDIYGEPKSEYSWSDRKAYDRRWTFYNDQDRATTYVYFKQGRVVRWNTRKRNQ